MDIKIISEPQPISDLRCIFMTYSDASTFSLQQRCSRGHKARGQGQGHKKNPRPRTALPRTDTLEANDRNPCGQGQGPRTQTQVFQKKRSSNFFFRRPPKKSLQKFFSRDLQKNGLEKLFSANLQNFNHSKNSVVLKPRTGQFSNTLGFETKAKDLTFETKAKDFKMCSRGRPQGQGRS